jgi:hypothetical protein
MELWSFSDIDKVNTAVSDLSKVAGLSTTFADFSEFGAAASGVLSIVKLFCGAESSTQ